jgi:uncharacterized protein Yka (UPF0111/DUF47 family)
MEGNRMKPLRWFTPQTPDLLGMLREQAEITVEGLDALLAWSRGDPAAAERLFAAEQRADERKRALRVALTEAFVTPLEPEDLFALSRGLDDVINSANNTVREAELMRSGPDAAIGAMAGDLVDGMHHLLDALSALGHGDEAAATRAADEAVSSQRGLQHDYRSAMSALIDVEDLREVAARRELYRRLARTGDHLVDVAERVWYAVLKVR